MKAEYALEAALRTASAGGAITPEDLILRALLAGGRGGVSEAARILAAAALLGRDYLEYWVDALGLQETWRPLR